MPRRVDALDTYPVLAVATGGNFSVALTRGGRAVTWGGGEFGQLGTGPAVAAQARVLGVERRVGARIEID